MEYLLALDQGTSSSRAIVFNRAGQIVASAQQEFPQHFPQPGWVEHDPFDIWNSQLATCRAALEQAKLTAANIATNVAALGITNQRETTMVWERATGKPIFNAIVWQDRRTESICERLRTEGLEDEVRKRTGLIIDPYFSATKLRWILDHVDGARERAARGELAFGTIDSWLVWQLTRGRLHVTDVSNASRTMLWNIHTGQWDAELMRALDIHPSLLPEVHPSAYQFGQTDADWLGASLTIGGIAGDQQSALFGQACFKPGMAKNTYGTGCFMLLNTGDKAVQSRNGLISTATCQSGPQRSYALEGSVFVGGAVVQWLRDGLRAIQRSADVEGLAASVPDSGGVVFVPSFTGLGAPYWDPTAQGAIVGLSRGTTIGHIARAALESIAFQSTALLQAMTRDAVSAITELRVDGGASANNLLLQFQADLLGIPVVRPEIIETTALGAAYLAGIATGFYHDENEVAQQWRASRTFHPVISRDEAEHRIAQWEMAVAQVRLPTTRGH